MVRVELDRDGSVGSKVIDKLVEEEQQRLMPQSREPERAPEVKTPATPATPATPIDPSKLPRGPTGKLPPTGPRLDPDGTRPPPSGPAAGADGPIERLQVFPDPNLKPSEAFAIFVEEKPILETIKRDPYIFIAAEHVPVMGTTIPHLKKRLRSFMTTERSLIRTH